MPRRFLGYMRSHRQAENRGSQILGDGQAPAVRGQSSEVRIGAREVRGDGVMDQRRDAGLGQLLLQRVPLRMPDDKQVPDWISPRGNKGQYKTRGPTSERRMEDR